MWNWDLLSTSHWNKHGVAQLQFVHFLGPARLRRRSKLQAAVQPCTLRPLWRIETVSGFEAIVTRRKATADNQNELEMWVEFFAIQS